MTGTIIDLAPDNRTGVIRSMDGSRISFSATVVLGDFDALAVGHWVSFDFDRCSRNRSAGRVMREPSGAAVPKIESVPDIRYGGFEQVANVRTYRFHILVSGHWNKQLAVTVDLALLLKYHVSVQEAPALCLRKLVSGLKGSPASQSHHLDNDDLLAFVASRAAAIERKRPKAGFGRRKGAPPPGPWNRVPAPG